MKHFLRHNGLWLLLSAAVLSGAIWAASFFLEGRSDPISNALSVITTPVRNSISAVADWGEGVYNYVLRYDEMQQELDALRLQVSEMEELARQGEDALRENAQLRKLMGLQDRRRDFVFESARVTAPVTSNWTSTLTISKGTNCGIEAGDCVVTETGVLVGVVSEVSFNASVVSTVINTDIDMGGMVARTYSAGILEGDFTLMQEGRLKLGYLPGGAQLVAGDEVLTSGKGGIYPSGLVVGQVEGVFTDPSGMTRYAVIRPRVDLDNLVEVFVIKEFDIIE